MNTPYNPARALIEQARQAIRPGDRNPLCGGLTSPTTPQHVTDVNDDGEDVSEMFWDVSEWDSPTEVWA